jgi:lysophospholipase L1-like esterase
MHGLVIRYLSFFLVLLTAMYAEAQNVKATGEPQRLIIIGASYAGGWQEPALPNYVVTNKGVGGEETHQVRARFERDVVAQKPDAVLIWGHINNIHRAPAGGMQSVLEKAKADYVDMIARARANGIRVFVGTEVTMIEAHGVVNRIVAFVNRMRGRQSYAAGINIQVRALNDWLRSYAQQQGLQVLDFEKVFDDGDGFRKSEYTSDDGSHISAEGYAALTSYARSRLGAAGAR